MKTYFIGYDLNNPGKDYQILIDELKKFFNWWHLLDSTWLIKSDNTATEIRDYLKKFIDNNDELLVINVTGRESAWTGFNDTGSKWLKDNL